MNDLMIIEKVRGYQDEKGVVRLNLEDVARGLGFTQIKNKIEYVRWETVKGYLKEFSFPTSWENPSQEFIPENIFYKLCFKAKNEIARKFQDIVTDKVLPAIRKTGGYIAGEESMNEDELILKAMNVLNTKVENLRKENKDLLVENNKKDGPKCKKPLTKRTLDGIISKLSMRAAHKKLCKNLEKVLDKGKKLC